MEPVKESKVNFYRNDNAHEDEALAVFHFYNWAAAAETQPGESSLCRAAESQIFAFSLYLFRLTRLMGKLAQLIHTCDADTVSLSAPTPGKRWFSWECGERKKRAV